MALDPKLTKFSTASPAIVSFSFEEIATGLGFSIFYGTSSEDSGGVDYHLISNPAYSSQIITQRASAGTTTMLFDLSPFNLSRTPQGTAYLSASLRTASGGTAKLAVTIKHYDGSTETPISSEITSAIAGSDEALTIFIEIPITTEKTFAKGDILRLTVDLITTGTAITKFGHDPKDRVMDVLSDTSVMEFQMPFKIE